MTRERSLGGGPDLATRAKRIATAALILGAVGICLVWKTWNTFFHYVEPGEVLIVISKTGDDLPAGELLAVEGQKGPLRAVLGEGRHFVMPFFHDVEVKRLADLNMEIPAESIGVVTARVGKDLPPGQILADKGEKGVLRTVLPPGRHRLNPYGYSVELKPATNITPGFVGFVTNLVGKDPTRYHVTLEEAVRKDAAKGAAVTEALKKVPGVAEVDASRIDAGGSSSRWRPPRRPRAKGPRRSTPSRAWSPSAARSPAPTRRASGTTSSSPACTT
jgi:hypothetical protein